MEERVPPPIPSYETTRRPIPKGLQINRKNPDGSIEAVICIWIIRFSSNRRGNSWLVASLNMSLICMSHSPTLKKEAVGSSETSVHIYQST